MFFHKRALAGDVDPAGINRNINRKYSNGVRTDNEIVGQAAPVPSVAGDVGAEPAGIDQFSPHLKNLQQCYDRHGSKKKDSAKSSFP